MSFVLKKTGRQFTIFILLALNGCINSSENQNDIQKRVEGRVRFVTVKDKELTSILDSVINFEKESSFYNETSHFNISLDNYYPNHFFIEALHDFKFSRHLKGGGTMSFFIYKKHAFVLEDNDLLMTGYFSKPHFSLKCTMVKLNEIYSIDDRGTVWKIFFNKDILKVRGVYTVQQ